MLGIVMGLYGNPVYMATLGTADNSPRGGGREVPQAVDGDLSGINY